MSAKNTNEKWIEYGYSSNIYPKKKYYLGFNKNYTPIEDIDSKLSSDLPYFVAEYEKSFVSDKKENQK